MTCQGRKTEAVQGWGYKPLEGKNSTLARSTRLLGATTRRFRLILSGREACRANGCPGEYTTKLCPEVLGRLLRSHRTCCSYVTRHHSKKSANLRVRSAPDVLSFESSNFNARPHASRFVWTKTIAIAGQNPDTSRLPCNTLLAERRVLLSRESVAATSLPRISSCHPAGACP